ncbi:hypothetical protein LC082_08850 [Microbacterium esteraromaticum]|uniref:hypothetical protein n=1 Tax=Microbacterium esteraromaticum TaxID=57043 RepID=UPI001CD5C2E2|nr:hypothetical protein [Microbacterium esteraromaticum]MCA1307007.1 hypothetical protein [Microbacterium esteraromaticum]
MSMDDPGSPQTASAKRSRRWPLSPHNIILVAGCLIAAVVCFILGQTYIGVVVTLAAIVAGIGAVFARRGRAGDLERINALEYADERDRAAATKALAAVGVLALVLALVQLIVLAIIEADPLTRLLSAGLVLALSFGWLFANWYFVRRG